MAVLISILVLGAISFAYAVYRMCTRLTIADIPGPDAESFFLGNLPELFQGQAAEADFEWHRRFGGIARIKAPFGEDNLWISDPKALQYIYQTSGYNFPKQPERRIISRLTGDYGLTWSEGETHKRLRKAMLPAFGAPESKALLPVFSRLAEQVSLRWRDVLVAAPGQTCVFNIPRWIAPATLDAIGEAAFDYKFGALDDSENELGKAYKNFMATLFSTPSKLAIFFQNIAHYVPMPVLEVLYDHLPGRKLDKARENRRAAQKVAEELLASKSEALLLGKDNRDVMSILVKANTSENEQTRMSHYEMRSQMRTLMLAGQETTSNTLSFAFMELAKHPDVQTRLRTDIRAMEQAVHMRGDSSFTVADLEAIPYLQAVLKEILRFHPVVYHNFRQSAKDDILPLSKPITTLSGEVISEIPIRKGLRLVLSVAAYNRDKEIWGEDAYEFNPDRWLDPKGRRGPMVGVWNNLLTFAGGLRACIGWRFAIYELQAFLAELVSNFEFAPTEDANRVRRENSLVMVPTLEGEIEKGAQLPLQVSLAPRE